MFWLWGVADILISHEFPGPKVRCLEDHQSLIQKHLEDIEEKVGIPVSEIDAAAATDYINRLKGELKTVDIDLRDAKRRISAAKPKKPKKVEEEFESEQSESE